MRKFMILGGLGEAAGQGGAGPGWQPAPEQLARMRATTELFLAHIIRPTALYRPDTDAIRATSVRIVVGAGALSIGQLPGRTAVALAGRHHRRRVPR